MKFKITATAILVAAMSMLIQKAKMGNGSKPSGLFWRRWTKEYLPTLICRKKWALDERALEVGDVVVIIDDLIPRNVWRKAVIDKIFRAKDQRVRAVRLITATGFFKDLLLK